jgi:hypothetical protein
VLKHNANVITASSLLLSLHEVYVRANKFAQEETKVEGRE